MKSFSLLVLVESLPPDFDMAKIGSSGQPSSDFHPDSLPMEYPSPAKNSMTLSVTSREEVFSISEVELFASTWPPKGTYIKNQYDFVLSNFW